MSLELVASLLNKIWLSKNKWKHYFRTKFKLLPKFACTWGVRNEVIIFRLSLVTNLVTYFPRLASQSPIRIFWTSQSFGAKLKMATSSKQLLASNICRNHLNMSKVKVWKKKKKLLIRMTGLKLKQVQGCRKKLFCGGILLANTRDVAQAEDYIISWKYANFNLPLNLRSCVHSTIAKQQDSSGKTWRSYSTRCCL